MISTRCALGGRDRGFAPRDADDSVALPPRRNRRRRSGTLIGSGRCPSSPRRSASGASSGCAFLAIHREVGHRRGEGLVLGNLGILRREQGRFTEASMSYERSLAIHREVGDRGGEGNTLASLANRKCINLPRFSKVPCSALNRQENEGDL